MDDDDHDDPEFPGNSPKFQNSSFAGHSEQSVQKIHIFCYFSKISCQWSQIASGHIFLFKVNNNVTGGLNSWTFNTNSTFPTNMFFSVTPFFFFFLLLLLISMKYRNLSKLGQYSPCKRCMFSLSNMGVHFNFLAIRLIT